MKLRSRATSIAVAASLAAAVTAVGPTVEAHAATDSFYSYDGSTPLKDLKPGTVLKTRTLPYHVAGIPLPLKTVQMLYRSTDQQGRPSANVTSVVKPLLQIGPPKAVSYQSFYDSLNPEDGPSRAIAGNVSLGGAIANAETLFIAPLLLQGYTVIMSDTEGQKANFAAGPEYGMNTLDSIRASLGSSATGLRKDTKVGLIGYSGGAIATGWASQLAPSYSPELTNQLVGAASGGVLVAPRHNLDYISGSTIWAGVAPMAIIGAARAFDIDFTPYLNAKGTEVIAKLQKASIINALGQYAGLTWKDLVKPEYANPNSIPAFVDAVNKLNMGSAPSPTMPVLIGQGAGGTLEGTKGDNPGIGPGDGVMVAGDVRTLARQFCASGTAVKYTQYDGLSHVLTVPAWVPGALLWLNDRFAAKPAPNNCSTIKPGNPLTPAVPTP